MSIERDRKWIEHPELVGKTISSFKRTDREPTGDNYIHIEFTDGAQLDIGANDLGTWVESPPTGYPPQPETGRTLRETALEYAYVKTLVEQLSPTDLSRLFTEVRAQAAKGEARPRARTAADFSGLWQGVTFSEEDFRAAEWHPDEALLNAG